MKVFELKEYCGKIMNCCHQVEACESMLTALDADLAVDIYQDTQPGGGNCYRDNRDGAARCEEELDQLSAESVFGLLYRKATDNERVLLTGLLDDFSKKFNDCVPEKADRAYQTTKFIECVCELDFAEKEITAEVISVLSKGGDYFQKLVDESYDCEQCKFTFTPDANTAAQFLANC